MSELSNQYVCVRCGYQSASKGNLVRHLQATRQCVAKVKDVDRDEQLKILTYRERPDKLYECTHCGAKYNHMSSLSKHKHVCKKKEEPKQNIKNVVVSHVPVPDGMDNDEFKKLEKFFNSMFEYKIVALENDIKHLKEQLISRGQINNTTTNNNQRVNQKVNIININNFGKEDTSHITPEFLSHCILNPTKGITSLIENIHYDPNKQCNANIRHKSSKQNTLEKWVHPKWVLCDASSTIDDLISKGYKLMSLHHQENFMNDSEIQDDDFKRQQYEYFRFLTDKNDYKYYKVKREIHCMIKNHTMNQGDGDAHSQAVGETTCTPSNDEEISGSSKLDISQEHHKER